MVNLAWSTKQCNTCSLQTVPHVVKCWESFQWICLENWTPAHQNKEREKKKWLLKYYFVQLTVVVKHSGQKDRHLTMCKSPKQAMIHMWLPVNHERHVRMKYKTVSMKWKVSSTVHHSCHTIIIIIHKFYIALFPAERAQRACSHTCA